jgi:uncharacterized membrane protein YukC
MDFTDPITIVFSVTIGLIVLMPLLYFWNGLLKYIKKVKKAKIETPYTNDIKDSYDKNDFEKPFTGE